MILSGKAQASKLSTSKAYRLFASNRRAWLVLAWVFVLATISYYAFRMVRVGIDLRQDFWVYWMPNHFPGDMNAALGHGNMVLNEAQSIAQDEQSKKSPEQLAEENAEAAAGHPIATIMNPGPGLFESPLSVQIFRQRWQHLRPIYGYMLRGWVQTYEHLLRDVGEGGDFEMDYPPLRLLVMTFWSWNVQTNYPGVDSYPRGGPRRIFDPNRNQNIVVNADMVQPMLRANSVCEGVSAISIFILVWLWMERRSPKQLALQCNPSGIVSWKDRWGDPMLLAPIVIFAICTYFRSNVTWRMSSLPDGYDASPIDARAGVAGWWLFLLMRFISAVCLARFLPRPFRAPMCGLIAATIAWLNPVSMLDSFGWPQWDVWLPPFFLLAAVFATINFWAAAGFMLGLGCMFKGQLLFVSPVLVLCPLIAGWPGRFLRLIAGMGAASGLVLWPWLVTNTNAVRWIFLAVAVAGFFCVLSLFRTFLLAQFRQLWRALSRDWPAILKYSTLYSAAGFLLAVSCLIIVFKIHRGSPAPAVLLAAGIFIVPWFIPRRLIGGWILLTFAASVWMCGSYLGGSNSWYQIGFLYGTQRHQDMQLGANSLSNLSSILHERYSMDLHDTIVTFTHPLFGTSELDTQSFCVVLFGVMVILCAIAAGIHMRRRDPKFLVCLLAPWMLFIFLLTQMAARYNALPAVISSVFIGVSAELSIFTFLQMVLGCIMLGNQMLQMNNETALIAFLVTHPTYPDLGWLTVTLAGVYLCCALVPSWNWRRPVEVV